jgi:hypothetical protein
MARNRNRETSGARTAGVHYSEYQPGFFEPENVSKGTHMRTLIHCCLIGLFLVIGFGHAIAADAAKQDMGKALADYMTKFEDIAKTQTGPERDKKIAEIKSSFDGQRKSLSQTVGSALTKFETAILACNDKKDATACGQIAKVKTEIENLVKTAAAPQKGGIDKETEGAIGSIIDMIR